jgi:SAM-dependent methyltransferase
MDIGGASSVFSYHRGMLQDRARVDAYRAAIHALVRPGDIVLDIGTGTGLLSYFACQAGARRVYAIEAAPVIALARELAQANGLADRITFVPGSSLDVTLPERADVLITETLWNFGVGEGMIGFVEDARRRLLQPGARILPGSVDLHLTLIQHPELHDLLTRTPEDRHGLDFSAMRGYAVNQVLTPRVDPKHFLTAPARLLSIRLDEPARPDFGARVALRAERAGRADGIAGWFEAELAPGITIGNAPPAEGSSWAHALFPIERPIPIEAGGEAEVAVHTASNGAVWRWSVEASGAKVDQTSFFGFPHDSELHRRRAGTAKLRRGPRGEAMLFVLNSFDGETSLEEVTQRVEASFGDVFRQDGSAGLFVRNVAETYGAAKD